jgi:16S rRNA G966 N2-methylase RsmD
MIINREWAMPNKYTFQIPCIRKFIDKYTENKTDIVDPFCGKSVIANKFNDLHISKIDSTDWLKTLKSNSADIVLFDPPYSPRQLKECYDSIGCVLHDTKSSVWKTWKDEILLVAHGGNHNDTICMCETKLR